MHPSRFGLLSGLALTGAVCCVSQVYLLQLTPVRQTALMLLIKVYATATVYRGHRLTLFSCRDYLPVHYVHRNYLAEVRTPAAGLIALNCTWHQSALTIGLHGQVWSS